MINEIYPHHFSNRFIADTSIASTDYILHYHSSQILLVQSGEAFQLPRKSDVAPLLVAAQTIFLFSLNGTRCFLLLSSAQLQSADLVYKGIDSLRSIQPQEVAWAGIVGFQLMNWYVQNRFCGKCGTPTTLKPDERAIQCPSCGAITYPRISPAIIVAITCGDKILLAHNANFAAKRYSLVAGYVDIGESLEEAVVREVREEVGLEVRNIRYLKSQPWPFSGSMMVGFTAEADDSQPIRPDNVEITHAQWFSRGALPNHPPRISIAGEIIDLFERDLLSVR